MLQVLMTDSTIKGIKRFFFRLILISFIIFLCDFCIGTILKFFYFRQSSGLLYRATYAIDSTKADILVFGSSRASHHYVPEQFTKIFKKSFYNTGRDGNFILYNLAIFNAIIKRYYPDMVIFDIRQDEFYKNVIRYDRLSSLLPYCKSHSEIQTIVRLKSPFEEIKLFSQIYPFNSLVLSIAIGNLEINKKRKPDHFGYVPIKKTMSFFSIHELRRKETSTDFDLNALSAINDIIYKCKKNNIKLIFVNSPMYVMQKDDLSYIQLKKIFEKNNINFYNFANHNIFVKDPTLFADPSHLNDGGAKLFSQLISDSIRNN